MPQADSSPPPTPDETRAHWAPRVRGGATVIGGTLAYVALAAAFGSAPTFLTALVGMLGSVVMMSWVWYLEFRRATKHHGPERRGR